MHGSNSCKHTRLCYLYKELQDDARGHHKLFLFSGGCCKNVTVSNTPDPLLTRVLTHAHTHIHNSSYAPTGVLLPAPVCIHLPACLCRCDFPPEIKDRPVLTAAKNKFESCQQMNDAVTATLTTGAQPKCKATSSWLCLACISS